ncbi:DUF2808 domain-containing protein [Iningainema tapete]|uniref:DUF2808 domain-containing protein n=1 Tax=Iningainema tapete BLCC-T55 TaxID=2748662 RepID=A0A8J7C4U4_9CYAN|nr:DUF2808 domain-containing protein [Iningainema tapete]MBD2772094.1 DUF2808 domain-containing protein [Iningainema tapete BLCC-T55]
MKKTLIYAGAALALATAVLIPSSYASARSNDGRVPHIDGNMQFPPNRSRIVRHTVRLHVPQNSKAVTQLLINVPNNLTVSNDIKDIDVADENEQKINTNVSINSRTILLAFPEPVAPNTKFNIDLNNVKRSILGNGSVYRFWAKESGSDAEIPIGVAQFRIY